MKSTFIKRWAAKPVITLLC